MYGIWQKPLSIHELRASVDDQGQDCMTILPPALCDLTWHILHETR